MSVVWLFLLNAIGIAVFTLAGLFMAMFLLNKYFNLF